MTDRDWMLAQADATTVPLADNVVDMVLGSPPYQDARTYGIDAQRKCEEWVDWMLEVSTECARVCWGPIFWVVWGVTRKRNYWPAPEGLQWKWWKQGGECQLYRPSVFHRVGIPGSGGTDYLRADWEYVVCLKRPGELPWSENTAMGHPPKWAPGGEMSYRLSDGTRVNQWGGSYPPESQNNTRRTSGKRDKKFRPSHRQHTKCRADGEMEEQNYIPPVLANPGNVIHCKVGGGQMGHPLAHKNEAPFPEDLAEFFIRSFCPPRGLVLDPFVGSGTTLAAAWKAGRRGIGFDIRDGEGGLDTARRRLLDTTAQQLMFRSDP